MGLNKKMSRKFPIVALTGASGAGKTNVKEIFKQIFNSQGIKVLFVEGDSFHRFTRQEMEQNDKALQTITHFNPEANLLKELEDLFATFSLSGAGKTRHYIHSEEDFIKHNTKIGHFSAWKEIAPADFLFYEGLHAGHVDENINIARKVDLLIGVAPIINLEWIQKIERDKLVRGYTEKNAVEMIKKRLPDYIKYICPQFSRTDANIQRVPLVDTSNPFSTESIPKDSESLFIFEIKKPRRFAISLEEVCEKVPGSFLTSENSLASPGTSLNKLLVTIFSPTINRLASSNI